ncbi:hypothetical protein ACJX0J_009266 [Zea mays]
MALMLNFVSVFKEWMVNHFRVVIWVFIIIFNNFLSMVTRCFVLICVWQWHKFLHFLIAILFYAAVIYWLFTLISGCIMVRGSTPCFTHVSKLLVYNITHVSKLVVYSIVLTLILSRLS